MSDFKFALRQLLKNPGFSAVAVLTLALGIGVNTSMYSALQSVMMPELPYPDSDRLVRIFQTSPHSQRWPHAPGSFLDQRDQTTVFEGVVATTFRNFNLAEPGQPAERIRGALVSADLVSLLGIAPQLGRGFLPEEGQPGKNGVVVLNHAFWVNHFAADPGIIGRTLRLDGESVTVVGVMPPRFHSRQQWSTVDLLRPLGFSEADRAQRGSHYLDVFARLKPGVSLAQGNAALATLTARLRQEYPDRPDSGLRLQSLAAAEMDPRGRMMLWMMLGLAGFVLLIACANLANLQFARTALRAKELAIRGALGAQRGRLIRQLLTENLLLAGGGGVVGLLLAHWTNHWLRQTLVEGGKSLLAADLNLGVMVFAFGVSAASGLAFGLLPSWLASRTDLNTVLKQAPRGGGSAPTRMRNLLIVSQVALALTLLAGAGLVLSGLRQFGAADPGWRIDGLNVGHISLPAGTYPDAERRGAFISRLQESLASLPGVERAAVASSLPISGFRSHAGLTVEGDAGSVAPRLRSLEFVSPDYFATLGIRLVEGREFEPSDRVGQPEVVIVNQALARTYWPRGSALGKRLGDPGAWQEIVGVVEDVRSATDAGEPSTRLQSYRPLGQEPQSDLVIAVRGTVSADLLRRAVAEIDPDLPLSRAGSVRAAVDHFFGQASVAGWVLSLFAGLGLLLAALGTYGVIASFVNQRTIEIGVRLALGAQVRDVLWLVLGKGLRLTVVGVAIGWFGSFGLARALASVAPGLKANEPAVLFSVSGLLLAVATIACWLPARRASRVDPMVALRSE